MPRYSRRCRACATCLKAHLKLPCRSPLSSAAARDRAEDERRAAEVSKGAEEDASTAAPSDNGSEESLPEAEPEVLRRELALVLQESSGNLVMRCALVDGEWLYSAFDCISLLSGTANNPRAVYNGLSERYPEISTRRFKFEGRGQKPTPVATQIGLLELMVLVPGPKAAVFRLRFCSLVSRLIGDGNAVRLLLDLPHVRSALDGQGLEGAVEGQAPTTARVPTETRDLGMAGEESLYIAVSAGHPRLVKFGISRNPIEREYQLSVELGDVQMRIVYPGAGELELIIKRQQRALQEDVAGRRRVFGEFYRMTLAEAEEAVSVAHASFLAAREVRSQNQREGQEQEHKRRRLECATRAEEEKARLEVERFREEMSMKARVAEEIFSHVREALAHGDVEKGAALLRLLREAS
jgi:hypothetical protein